MSIINQALKKAQRERLLHNAPSMPPLARQPSPRYTGRRLLMGLGPLTVLGGIMALYLWPQSTAPIPQVPINASRRAAVQPEMTDTSVRLFPSSPASKVTVTNEVITDVPIPRVHPPRPEARVIPPYVPDRTPQMSRERPTPLPAPAAPPDPPAQVDSRARDLFKQALAFQQAGQQSRALPLLQQTVEFAPDFKEAYNSLGNLLYRQQNYNQAIEMYRKALEIDPDYAKARNNLGSTYLRLAMDERALEELQKAVQVDDTYGLAYYNLACVYARAGDSAAAVKYLQRAITIEPRARTWAQSDNDFSRVRNAPEIQRLLGPS